MDTTFENIKSLLDVYLNNELRLRDYLKKRPDDKNLSSFAAWNEGKDSYVNATSASRVNLEYSLSQNVYFLEEFKQELYKRKEENDKNEGDTADFINLVYNDLDKRCDDLLKNYVSEKVIEEENVDLSEDEFFGNMSSRLSELEKEIYKIIDVNGYVDALAEQYKIDHGIITDKSQEEVENKVKEERIKLLGKFDFLKFNELAVLYNTFLELLSLPMTVFVNMKKEEAFQDIVHLIESYLIENYHDEFGERYQERINSDLLTKVNYENNNGFMSYFGIDYYELTGKKKKVVEEPKKEINVVVINDKVHELDIIIEHMEEQLDKLKSVRDSLKEEVKQ